MKSRFILSVAALILIPAAFTGCGSDPEVAPTYNVSVGQQLSDLDQARKDDLITDREYRRLKKALIARYD